MPHPPRSKKFYEKNAIDRAIDAFALLERPTVADLNRVSVIAQVEVALAHKRYNIHRYREEGLDMAPEQMEEERHNSERLGVHMAQLGDPRPHELCDAHAIISGAHHHAERLRAVLAWIGRRIDDAVNGCWLPRNTAALPHMPGRLRSAVPHSRIHRKKYYRWIEDEYISMDRITDDAQLILALNRIGTRLQAGSFPPWIMEK